MRSVETDQSTSTKAKFQDPSALLCTGQSYLERLGVVYMDRIRLHIVTELFMREMTPAQFFATVGGTSYPAVRRHFVKLVETGWLRQVRPAAGGPGKPGMLHRATELPVIDNETFERFPMSIRDAFTVQFLEEMGCRLGEAVTARTPEHGHDPFAQFQAAELDEPGWCKALAAVERCFKVLSLIQQDAKVRIDHGHGRPLSMIVNLAAFQLPPARAPVGFVTELPPVDRSSLVRDHWPQRIGKVFVDPLNLAIIEVLNRATMNSNELHDYFGVRTPRKFREKCQHLAELGWLAEVAARRPGGAHRGARPRRFRATTLETSQATILHPIPASARRGDVWRVFDRFCSASVDALKGGTFNLRSDRHLTLSQLLVDDLGWTQVIEALTACTDSLAKAERDARRRHRPGKEVFSIGLLVSGIEAPFRGPRG